MTDTRFNLANLPLAFFDEFHHIETDALKKAILELVNYLYDDYTVEEVQDIFSSFSSTSYEVYNLFQYRNDYDTSTKAKIDMLIEVILYCSSQLESYQIRPLRCNKRVVKA